MLDSYGDVAFSLEKYQDIYEEMYPLIQKHYKEISHYQDIELKIDNQMYFQMERVGALKAFTARLKGELIGYAVFFVRNNLHYSDSMQALQDVIFIDPTRRGFGKYFINWCDMWLKDYGVQVVYHHVKDKFDFGPMLYSLGYEKIDIVYGRRLDRET